MRQLNPPPFWHIAFLFAFVCIWWLRNSNAFHGSYSRNCTGFWLGLSSSLSLLIRMSFAFFSPHFHSVWQQTESQPHQTENSCVLWIIHSTERKWMKIKTTRGSVLCIFWMRFSVLMCWQLLCSIGCKKIDSFFFFYFLIERCGAFLVSSELLLIIETSSWKIFGWQKVGSHLNCKLKAIDRNIRHYASLCTALSVQTDQSKKLV